MGVAPPSPSIEVRISHPDQAGLFGLFCSRRQSLIEPNHDSRVEPPPVSITADPSLALVFVPESSTRLQEEFMHMNCQLKIL